MKREKWKNSSFVSLVAVFAAFSIICDSFTGPPLPFSGVWYSWIFIAEPINGIILGPYAGFLSSLIGVMVGHSIYLRGYSYTEFLFTFGAPIGAMISGLIFRGKWKIALVYYSALLGVFFITPVSWELPFWGMWDVYLAFACLLFLIIVIRKQKGLWDTRLSDINLLYVTALSTFIGLEADVLFRIFLFIPCQTYRIFFALDTGTLQVIWAVGAVETSTKAALSILVNMIVIPPLVKAVRKMQLKLLS
jgi:hypothetical protein